MEKKPTLNQSRSVTMHAGCFMTAGWMLAQNPARKPVKISLQLARGHVYFGCEIHDESGKEFDVEHFVQEMVAAPEQFSKTAVAGLEQLAVYLNRALEGFESGTALNTNREQLQENAGLSNLEGSKKIAALDAEKEAVHG